MTFLMLFLSFIIMSLFRKEDHCVIVRELMDKFLLVKTNVNLRENLQNLAVELFQEEPDEKPMMSALSELLDELTMLLICDDETENESEREFAGLEFIKILCDKSSGSLRLEHRVRVHCAVCAFEGSC